MTLNYILAVFIAGLTSLTATRVQRTAILVDPFTEYISGHCKEYCEENGIRVVELVSPFTAGFFKSRGNPLPDSLIAPKEGDEMSWASNNDISLSDTCNCCVIPESDACVPTAERIAAKLNIRGNGVSPQLRNKFKANERARSKGLKVVKQVAAKNWEEAEEFLTSDLWGGCDELEQYCVVKPCRGVASDGVHLCRSLVEARKAFKNLHNKHRFGGGKNDVVLIQEFVTGQEYAVDTVAMNGHIKVVALWKYSKRPANGAPFVYQCSRLCSADSAEAKEVCDYCIAVLKAQGLKWGPTHTEIMATSDGPRLIEINARFHAQHFEPIVRSCLGYDAMRTTLDSYFFPEKFLEVPERPDKLISNGLILHLISFKEGTISKINHLEEIENLPSVKLLHLESSVGDELVKTVDIRTDCGYVLLVHDDPDVIARDYDHIVSLQSTMFEIEQEEKEEDREVADEPATVDSNESEKAVGGGYPRASDGDPSVEDETTAIADNITNSSSSSSSSDAYTIIESDLHPVAPISVSPDQAELAAAEEEKDAEGVPYGDDEGVVGSVPDTAGVHHIEQHVVAGETSVRFEEPNIQEASIGGSSSSRLQNKNSATVATSFSALMPAAEQENTAYAYQTDSTWDSSSQYKNQPSVQTQQIHTTSSTSTSARLNAIRAALDTVRQNFATIIRNSDTIDVMSSPLFLQLKRCSVRAMIVLSTYLIAAYSLAILAPTVAEIF